MTDRLVRIALRGNAVFSALSGVAALVAAVAWPDALGIPPAVLVALGLALLPYAALLAMFAGRPEVRVTEVRLAVVADEAWVAGAAVILIGSPDAMSSAGRWALGLLTLVVADFAVAQWIGLRRLQTGSGPQNPAQNPPQNPQGSTARRSDTESRRSSSAVV